MITSVSIGLFVFITFIAFLLVARRVLRLALKLAFVGAVAATLFAGVTFGWWRGWFSPAAGADRGVTQTNHRTNINRRTSR
jgi:hypothetical protein